MTAFKRNIISTFLRFYSVNSKRKNICIVGSGPGGFYTAHHLLKFPEYKIDIFEKLPVPFGLIRYGVAPDHPEIKNVTKLFTKIALNKNCNFYGNVNVGKDVSVAELLQSYNAVILAFGASHDRLLGIPGEESPNVLSARSVVGWYTGHPDFVDLKIDLDTEVAAIVGHGNVALDVARIFLKKVDDLKSTDISEHAYEALKKSRINRIVLIGRRGPLQVAFNIKEYRELTRLDGCHIEMLDDYVHTLPVNLEVLDRAKKRMAEVLLESINREKARPSEASRSLELKFFRIPKEILSDSNSKVEKLVLNVNSVEGTYCKDANFKETEDIDIIDCGMIVRSVGYQGATIDPFIPFDLNKSVIANKNGKVSGVNGLYCSGWIKTGPIGVILATMYSSYRTGEQIVRDNENGELPDNLPQSPEYILNLLKNKGVQVITFEDWLIINKVELERGRKRNKSRDLVYDTKEMLRIIAKGKTEC